MARVANTRISAGHRNGFKPRSFDVGEVIPDEYVVDDRFVDEVPDEDSDATADPPAPVEQTEPDDETPEPATPDTGESESNVFDPSLTKVAEVQAWVQAGGDDAAVVARAQSALDAESAGQDRVTLVDWLLAITGG